MNIRIHMDGFSEDSYEDAIVTLITTARTYYYTQSVSLLQGEASHLVTIAFSESVDMTANDTAVVRVTVTGGAKNIDVNGAASPDICTSWSGFLIY